jgi:hypothetical protein
MPKPSDVARFLVLTVSCFGRQYSSQVSGTLFNNSARVMTRLGFSTKNYSVLNSCAVNATEAPLRVTSTFPTSATMPSKTNLLTMAGGWL